MRGDQLRVTDDNGGHAWNIIQEKSIFWDLEWNRNIITSIHVFCFSFKVGKLRFCGDNETFVTSTENPVNLIHWSLHGREPAKPLLKYPKLQRKSKYMGDNSLNRKTNPKLQRIL